MSFDNLHQESGVEKLNKHLENYSYVGGYTPSKSDVSTFETVHSLSPQPDAKKFPHVHRWAAHIASWSEAERNSWPAGEIPTHHEEAHSAPVAHEQTHAAPAAHHETPSTSTPHHEAPPAAKKDAPAAEDDVDLFGDDDDEETEKRLEEIKKEHEAKRGPKKVVIAKSSILFDVKPWDDTTDLGVMEEEVRKITLEGLHWGASKLVPLAFGIKKLQILATVIDDVCSVDEIEERITSLEELVQSVDIAAFNKI